MNDREYSETMETLTDKFNEFKVESVQGSVKMFKAKVKSKINDIAKRKLVCQCFHELFCMKYINKCDFSSNAVFCQTWLDFV